MQNDASRLSYKDNEFLVYFDADGKVDYAEHLSKEFDPKDFYIPVFKRNTVIFVSLARYFERKATHDESA